MACLIVDEALSFLLKFKQMKLSNKIKKTLRITIVILLSIISKINAATITSAGNGNWNLTTTWVGNVVPSSGDNVIIKTGNIVTVIDSRVIVDITIETGATIIVNTGKSLSSSGTISQAGTLTVDGTYNLNGGTLNLDVANTFSGSGVLNIFANIVVNSAVGWEPTIATINYYSVTLSGTAALTIPASTTFNVLNECNFTIAQPLTNNGTFNINGYNGSYNHNFASDIINNGTFNWKGDGLDLSGGGQTFTNNGTFNVSTSANTSNIIFINNGTVSINKSCIFSKPITNNSSASFTVNAGMTLNASDLNLAGTFVVNGILQFSNTSTITINQNNVLTGIGSMAIYSNTVINSSIGWEPTIATINYSGGIISGSAAFSISASTTFNLLNEGNITLTQAIIVNGIFNIVNGNQSYKHNFASDIINNGTFNWNGDGLDSDGGGQTFTNNGTFNANSYASTANIDFVNNGTVTLNANCTFQRPITNNPNASFTVNIGKTLNASDLNLSGTFVVNGNLQISGTITANQKNVMSGTGTLTISSNIIINSSVGWEPTIATIDYYSVTISGNAAFSISASTTFNLKNEGNITLTQVITNNGIFNINPNNQGYKHNFASDIINNGTFNYKGDGLDLDGGGQTFTNNGIFNVPNNTTTANIDFINNGTVNINGQCFFTRPFTNNPNASLTIASGYVVKFGDLNLSGTFVVNGTIIMDIGGTITVNQNNVMSGTGILTIESNIIINSTVGWEPTISTINYYSFIISGNAAFSISASTTFNILQEGNITLTQAITNNGTFNITGYNQGYNHNFASDIINNGTFNWVGDALDNGGGGQTFTNNGVFNAGNINVGPTTTKMNFQNSGTMNIIKNATFTQSIINNLNGILISKSPANLTCSSTITNDGTLKGTGNITASGGISGSGKVAPGLSPGTLTITGNYTNVYLDLEIDYTGGVVTKDLLIVTGNATLGGTLKLTETGNVPAGTYILFQVSGTMTGTFSTVDIPDCYTLEYGAKTVSLKKGVSRVWDGTVNTWDQPSHWNPYGVPCPLDDVIINSGECSLNIQPDMKTLTINGGSLKKINPVTYTINAPTVVSGSGKVNVYEGTLGFSMTLDNNGTIQGYATIDISGATMLGGYGKWAPGNSSGTLSNTGTYNNEMIEMEIGGNAGGLPGVEIDKLNVSQTMVTNGDINILWLGGTIPIGNRLLMECALPNCRTGVFTNITFPPECNGKCNILYTPEQVRIENTEPIEFIGTCTWIGGTGNWSNASNWSCNDVPNFNDDVIINTGQVTFDSPTTIKTLILGGNASLNGANAFNITNNFTWTGGQLNNNGITTSTGPINISGSVALSNGNLVLSNGGTITNSALSLNNQAILSIPFGKTMDLNYTTTGSITGLGGSTIINNGTLNKIGGANLDINSAIQNNGIIKINGGTLSPKSTFSSNGTIMGSGTLNLQGTNILSLGTLAPGNSPGTINVTGTYPNQKIIIEIQQSGGLTSIDKLIASGDLILGNNDTLVIDHLGGFIEYATFNFMNCTGGPDCRKNTFDMVVYPSFCDGECSIEYTLTGANLKYEKLLPVELAYFNARLNNSEVALNWTTLSEENADYYEIMRSTNTNEWTILGAIQANGTSTSAHDYSFLDTEPESGDNYYRLKQHDLNGDVYYSKVIRIKTPIKKSWKLFPNPVSNVLEIKFSETQDGILNIFDNTGKPIIKKTIEGEKSLSLDVSILPAGLYWVQMPGFKTEMVVKR